MYVNLTHARLLVRDFPACFRFYRDVIGLTPTLGQEDDVYAEFESDNAILALFRAELMSEALGENTAAAPNGDRVVVSFDVEDVDAAFEAMRARGAAVVAPPTDRPDWFLPTAHFRDPDGNLIEINHSLES